MKQKEENKENIAVAKGLSMPISTKDCIEICNFLRGMTSAKAKIFLEDVIALKRAVPLKRFGHNLGHKPGIGSGRYPVKACKEVLKLIKSAEANASFKGLNTSATVITKIIANKGSRSYHYGRMRGIKTKSTHVFVTLEEIAKKEEKKEAKKEVKKDKVQK